MSFDDFSTEALDGQCNQVIDRFAPNVEPKALAGAIEALL